MPNTKSPEEQTREELIQSAKEQADALERLHQRLKGSYFTAGFLFFIIILFIVLQLTIGR